MLRYVNVFISAAAKDLQTHRSFARDSIISAGMYPIGFETHLLTGGNVEDLTRQLIDQSDVFVGIYAYEAGTLVSPQQTWLEFEYEYAIQQHKELIFFMSWDAMNSDPNHPFTSFKTKIMRQHKVNEFDYQNPSDLKTQLLHVLSIPPTSYIGIKRQVIEPIFDVPSSAAQFHADIFMVMPFRADLRPIYDDHIKKVVTDLGLNIKRGDDFFAQHAIMQDIWSATNAAKLIIADCTGKNPNVFYEMGIAHTLGKPILMIAQNADDIPFDLRQYRYIPYEYTPRGMQSFEENLKTAICRLLKRSC